MYRQLSQAYPSRPSRDGDGVKINRIAGASMHGILDPFLMVDEINSDTTTDYMGGFPEHTYELAYPAPHAYQCHPPDHEENLMPLMVAAGAAGESGGRKVYLEKVLLTQLSAFRFD